MHCTLGCMINLFYSIHHNLFSLCTDVCGSVKMNDKKIADMRIDFEKMPTFISPGVINQTDIRADSSLNIIK